MTGLLALDEQQLLDLANRQAQRFNHKVICPKHVMLGLMNYGNMYIKELFHQMEGDFGRFQKTLEQKLGKAPEMVVTERRPVDQKVKKAIRYAKEEARRLHNDDKPSPLEWFLGLMHPDVGIESIFKREGFTEEKVRQGVYRLESQFISSAQKEKKDSDAVRSIHVSSHLSEIIEKLQRQGYVNDREVIETALLRLARHHGLEDITCSLQQR